MILNRILSLCGQSCIGRIGLLSLLIGLSGCQDFTDDTGMTLPEPDLKFVDETLNLPLDERNIQWISNRISLGG